MYNIAGAELLNIILLLFHWCVTKLCQKTRQCLNTLTQ